MLILNLQSASNVYVSHQGKTSHQQLETWQSPEYLLHIQNRFTHIFCNLSTTNTFLFYFTHRKCEREKKNKFKCYRQHLYPEFGGSQMQCLITQWITQRQANHWPPKLHRPWGATLLLGFLKTAYLLYKSTTTHLN